MTTDCRTNVKEKKLLIDTLAIGQSSNLLYIAYYVEYRAF